MRTESVCGTIRVDAARIEDLAQIVSLHIATNEEAFLTSLGEHFLDSMYKHFVKGGEAIAGVAREIENGAVVGSVIGCTHPKRFYRKLMLLMLPQYLRARNTWSAIRKRVSADILQRYIVQETIIPGGRVAYAAQLNVSRDFQRRGIGTALMQYFYNEVLKRGVDTVYIIINENNYSVKVLHEKMGSVLMKTFLTPSGIRRHLYVKDLGSLHHNVYLGSQMCNLESIATFFRALGHRVLFTPAYLWHEVGPRVFFPLPYHKPFRMPSRDLESLWSNGALFVRYPSADETDCYRSYIHLLTNKNYRMSDLKSKSRNATRRGLENCSVRRISFDHLLREGLPLIKDTTSRHGRPLTNRVSKYWQEFFSHAGACPAVEAWGAFVGNALAAYLLAIIYGECAHMHMIFSRTDLLKYRPVNALSFVFGQNAIRRPGVSFVSYGMRSIKGDADSLNKFKQGMGFMKVVVGERIEVNPWLKSLFESGLARAVAAVSRRYCERSEFAANIYGLTSTFLKQDRLE